MRNKYPGECYRCNQWVPAGEGHFERLGSSWRVQHATCAIELRGAPDPVRQERSQRIREAKAKGTGRRAQRARAALRQAAGIALSSEAQRQGQQGCGSLVAALSATDEPEILNQPHPLTTPEVNHR